MNDSNDCILTYSKLLIDPFNIKANEIMIEDIAHSLSQMARANGHFKHFYSVAQHSINCSIEAKNRGFSERIQLACLLHDASESYIADIPRPVKHRLLGYADIEQKIFDTIFNMYGITELTDEEIDMIKEIDNALLFYEFEELMGVQLFETPPYISMKHNFGMCEIIEVKKHFISVFNKLISI